MKLRWPRGIETLKTEPTNGLGRKWFLFFTGAVRREWEFVRSKRSNALLRESLGTQQGFERALGIECAGGLIVVHAILAAARRLGITRELRVSMMIWSGVIGW